jgi:hypothetical protein
MLLFLSHRKAVIPTERLFLRQWAMVESIKKIVGNYLGNFNWNTGQTELGIHRKQVYKNAKLREVFLVCQDRAKEKT